jgi:hypothetical protein
VEDVFNQVKAVDDLLSLVPIELDRPASYGFLTYKNLILTLWAGHYLKLPQKKLIPLDLKKFKPFFENLLPAHSNCGPAKPRKVPAVMKSRFLNWLAENTGLRDFEISERMGGTLENLFEEIENELGKVAVEDLEPKYVHLFLLT